MHKYSFGTGRGVPWCSRISNIGTLKQNVSQLKKYNKNPKEVKMKKSTLRTVDILSLILCAVLLFCIGVGVYVLPRDKVSEAENRVLSDFPKASAKTVLDGSFFERLSAFYSDSVPFRETLIRTKAYGELSLGKAQNNGVIFLPDGRLVDRCEYDGEAILQKNLALIGKLGEDVGRCAYALVPRSVDVYVESENSKRVTDAVYEKMGGRALFDALLEQDRLGKDVYYMTDHHLDCDGAYTLYEYVVTSLGYTAFPKSAFEKQTVSEDFLGSIYSKSGLVDTAHDTVELWRYAGDTEARVSCADVGCELDGLYSPQALEHKDKYQIFTGGNHGCLEISLADGNIRPSLLVVKDSFANAILPMLARHFDLTVIDPRYTSQALPQRDMTAFIFGIDTLATTRIKTSWQE